MRVVVVGAGVAGLSCARELAAAGVEVRVRERGRVVGGRLASRRFDGRYTDTGAAYLTADDPDFAAVVEGWRERGLARPWTDTLRVYDPDAGPRERRGPVRWAAPGGLRSLAEDLAAGLDVTLTDEVGALPEADAVVLAMPGPQALRLADLPAARAQTWSPVLAAVLSWPRRDWPDFRGAFVNGHPVLASVCDDGDRRGDGAPVLVAHSTAAFARPRLGDPDAAGPPLAAAAAELLGLDPPAAVRVHRWTYAQPGPGAGGFAGGDGLYLAGDAFDPRPRVQAAWLSGRAAARAVLAAGG